MKHFKATISAMLIPLLGVCSCSSQRAAAKAQRDKEKQEQTKEQRDAEPVKRVETDPSFPPPVVYGPPPSVYEKMPEPVLEDISKKN